MAYDGFVERLVVGGVLLALGCGSGSDGRVLSGTVGDRSFVVRDAIIATTTSWKSAFSPGDSTVIVLSDAANLCDQITTDLTKPDTQFVLMELAEVTQGTASPISGPGTFTWSSLPVEGRISQMFYAYVTPSCASPDVGATSGSVTITELGAGGTSARGSLSIAFGAGSLSAGSLEGKFQVPASCPTEAVDAYLNKSPTCGTP